MRQSASWVVISLLIGVAALQPGGCAGPLDPGESEPPVDADRMAELLEHTRTDVMVPALEATATELDALQVAVDAWAANPMNDGLRADAQDAFAGAMAQWAVVDALQVGPGAPSLASPAGEDRRDEAYSWPTVNPCRVDQETVAGDYSSATFFEQELVNVYGFDALEHLLYAPSENACPSQVDINAEGSWAALGPDVVAQARAEYASAVVGHLSENVASLRDGWSGSFGDDFVAGRGAYDEPTEALDDLFRAMFYIETMKDAKLAYPLGLRECGAAACPEMAESQAANLSAVLLQGNLDGLAAILDPADGTGFTVLLEESGADDVAEALRDRVTSAVDAVGQLRSVRDEVVDDPDVVQAAYDAVAELAALLEGDVATVLTLTVPSEAAGDAD